MTASTIKVNGVERQLEGAPTVAELVESLDLHPAAVAVEHNGAILKRDELTRQRLAAGDEVEIVRFVQGG